METYDEIYGRMKNAYEYETGDSFNEVSDIAIRLKVLAGEIFKLQTNLEWWKRQMFAVSAQAVNALINSHRREVLNAKRR